MYPKMPVASLVFLVELIKHGKKRKKHRSHASSAYENRIYLQANLNEPCRNSMAGSFSGQLEFCIMPLLDPRLQFVRKLHWELIV